MITKMMLFYVVFLISIKLSYCQVPDVKNNMPFFDADSIRLGVFYKTNEKIDSTVYWDSGEKKIDVLFEVPKCKLSFDSLNNFLLEQFRMRVNYEEVNGAALVYILLECAKIKEIRIAKRIGYHRKYDPFIKETLMETQGNWFMSEKVSKPVLFVYLFKMK